MIAAVRRILVLTAEFGKMMEQGRVGLRYAMIDRPAHRDDRVHVLPGGLRKRDKRGGGERA